MFKYFITAAVFLKHLEQRNYHEIFNGQCNLSYFNIYTIAHHGEYITFNAVYKLGKF